MATVHDLSGQDPKDDGAVALAQSLYSAGVRSAICNTTVSGFFAQTLKNAGFSVVSLIHELPNLITNYELEGHAEAIAKSADRIVFPAEIVAEGFSEFARLEASRRIIRPQGAYKRNSYRQPHVGAQIRARMREQS